MQKKFIALAVAGLMSGAAFAQSNVTIYGLVDVGAELGNGGFGQKFRVQSGQSAGNRLGFKGEEALGNGLKATFQLETGFSVDTGMSTNNSSQMSSATALSTSPAATNTGGTNGATATNDGTTLFQRMAVVGLNGGFGAVTVGRQYTPQFSYLTAVDPFGAGLAGSNGVSVTGLAGYAQRLDNSVVYTSPNVSGFTGQLGYSSGNEHNQNGVGSTTPSVAGGTISSDRAGQAWVAGVTYANGPAYAGLAYHKVRGQNFVTTAATALATDVTDNKSWLLAGSWDFKFMKLSATYASGNADLAGVGGTSDTRHYSLGLVVPVSAAAKIQAVYGSRDDRRVTDLDFNYMSLGGEYMLSKRTNLYAAYTKIMNKDMTTAAGVNTGAAVVANSALNTGLALSATTYDPTAIQFGLKHSF
jgi:predicted porin